tara:strand:- start:44 stop:775 length:732 start_codon:yes stop_codon:yes gene_type:complete
MIVLFTDFGENGPYLGQIYSVLAQIAPNEPVINLLSNAPKFSPRASAYLLAALETDFPKNSIFICVVDPGVGGDRLPLVLNIDGKNFIGPDNGLLSIVARRSVNVSAKEITWRPGKLSVSFHGRDLFAPIAAMIATGKKFNCKTIEIKALKGIDWPEDLASIIYIDHYGNAMTGIRAQKLTSSSQIGWSGKLFSYAETFSNVEVGKAFWYENSNGLVEIAVNQGKANALGFMIGDKISVLETK